MASLGNDPWLREFDEAEAGPAAVFISPPPPPPLSSSLAPLSRATPSSSSSLLVLLLPPLLLLPLSPRPPRPLLLPFSTRLPDVTAVQELWVSRDAIGSGR